ncbi:MAG: GTP 3',8-cyclase MoaA [Pseudomonadota bacterium]
MKSLPQATESLVDRFGRHVTYVRLSVTDRCDLRCRYCMSEDMEFLPRARILTLEEFARLGKIFASLGVKKIRVTGGEPLARSNVVQLFRELGALEAVKDLTITTNGTRLARYAEPLKSAGVTRVNISLDTLHPDRFTRLARVDALNRVLAGIDAARAAGFRRIKLNSVILGGHNDDEVAELARFALDGGMDISFIEEMPLGRVDDHDRALTYISSDQVVEILASDFRLTPSTASTGGPTRYFEVSGYQNRIGVISPHSHNFCDTCNRVRVTAEGRLLLCLGQEHSVDLRRVLRAYPADDEPVQQAIVAAMDIKPKGHEFDLGVQPVIQRHMNVTGG